MIWRKTWVESRTRFLIAAVVMVLTIGWAILNCDEAMRRWDAKPPITYTRYVYSIYASRF